MRVDRLTFGLAVVGVSCVSITLAACSGSSSTPPMANVPDATTDDGSDEAAAMDASIGTDSPSSGDGSMADGALDGALDGKAGDTSDAAVDAAADGGLDGAVCVPVDGGPIDVDAAAAGLALVGGNFRCDSCHGYDYSGGVTIAGAISKNLTPDPATGLGCWTSAQVVSAMLDGITPTSETLCVMPQWRTRGMTTDQAVQIAQYLRTLAPVSKQVPVTICPGADAGDGGDAGLTDAAHD